MGFRTIVINSRCKLEYSLNYLVYRGEEEKRIYLSEIETIIIQSTQVAITSCLICELTERKIKLIFCDYKNNPSCEILPLYGSYNTSGKINEQIQWKKELKDTAWKQIIKSKISFQAILLQQKNHLEEYNLIQTYINEIQDGDITNREGHSAKVYFNVIFGKDFSRQSSHEYNKYLNYGYSIILSAFNREIVSLGYITQIGIHHCNEENEFNLSCDFMEPFRLIVDQLILTKQIDNDNFKKQLITITNCLVSIDNQKTYLDNAIKIYVQSIFSYLNEKTREIKLPIKYEL